MWGNTMIPMYRLWLHSFYRLHGTRCPQKAVKLNHSNAHSLSQERQVHVHVYLNTPEPVLNFMWKESCVVALSTVYLKNFHDSSDICPMGFIYSIEICEISHQTFGPSHRKCPMCPMILMNTVSTLYSIRSNLHILVTRDLWLFFFSENYWLKIFVYMCNTVKSLI